MLGLNITEAINLLGERTINRYSAKIRWGYDNNQWDSYVLCVNKKYRIEQLIKERAKNG